MKCSALDGTPRQAGRAKSKETVFYDFNRDNAAFLLDIVHAFGIASQQHNEDIRKILGKILETAANPMVGQSCRFAYPCLNNKMNWRRRGSSALPFGATLPSAASRR